MNKFEQGWSVPIAVEDIPDAGGRYEISADRPAREAVAKLAGLRDLPRLDAVFDVTKQSNGIAVTGEVNARVGQNCVVTLEPIESEVREAVDLLFAPPEPAPREKRAKAKGEPPEILESNRDCDVWPVTRIRQGQPVTAPLARRLEKRPPRGVAAHRPVHDHHISRG